MVPAAIWVVKWFPELNKCVTVSVATTVEVTGEVGVVLAEVA